MKLFKVLTGEVLVEPGGNLKDQERVDFGLIILTQNVIYEVKFLIL
jgi:hypothetical protein